MSGSLQIRQTHARIGIDADLGQHQIRQAKADFELETKPGAFEIRQPWGELAVDSTPARDALVKGGYLKLYDRWIGEGKQLMLNNLAHRVQEGNRMAAIHTGENAIAAAAVQAAFYEHHLTLDGPYSIDNVELSYTPRKPEMRYTESEIESRIKANRPEIEYQRGKFEIYMAQRASIQFIPPQVDMTL